MPYKKMIITNNTSTVTDLEVLTMLMIALRSESSKGNHVFPDLNSAGIDYCLNVTTNGGKIVASVDEHEGETK
ncbi:hypothetical protein M316_0065 [Nitrincola phage 1M3-16]|uniref:hypothetical protein n=1 Tax=Nitrincola phage 1M3-16 TaxID=1472912 RepID=UPI000444B719|nr:hypothetical protein GJ22_gp087 [Nitrincola phage 1M3-16]AHX01130.1 hypothetical protein M316_0065 [Nitrincola phage 1M3-16]